jgi:hypothetical protein
MAVGSVEEEARRQQQRHQQYRVRAMLYTQALDVQASAAAIHTSAYSVAAISNRKHNIDSSVSLKQHVVVSAY